MKKINALLLICFASTLSSLSIAKNTINLPLLSSDIVIDGKLDEQIWKQAAKAKIDNIVYPYENKTTDIVTDVYLFEDGEFLYIAFNAKDPSPEKITDFLRARDSGHYDDSVGIKIDPFNDHKFSYNFLVTAGSAQIDSLKSEITDSDNISWDAFWESKAVVSKTGYVVEMAIPLKALTFDDSKPIQEWGFELVRNYVTDQTLEISNLEYDYNDSCSLCKMDILRGFKDAKVSNNLVITPSFVAKKTSVKDGNNNWLNKNNYEGGLDFRWGITPNMLLNATINPDFSAIESDVAQLNVNKTFSIYYDEKRTFFTDNITYFDSPLDIVYTRNISDPDYGVKFTGNVDNHSIGGFLVQDSQNAILIPGNLGSDIAVVDSTGHTGAFRYLTSVNEKLDFGIISTMRDSEEYHNYVTGIDGKYRFSDSDSIELQYLYSNTEYPDLLKEQLGGENALRVSSDSLNDNTYLIRYKHKDAKWKVNAEYKDVGKDFRADLGFLPQVDYNQYSFLAARNWVQDINDWSYRGVAEVDWNIKHNQSGDLIGQEFNAHLKGAFPLFPAVILSGHFKKKPSLRFDRNTLSINANVEIFDVNGMSLIAQIQPSGGLFFWSDFYIGDKIDYANNQLGKGYNASFGTTWDISRNIEIDITQEINYLEVNGTELFTAKLTDVRLKYKFNEKSFLRLTLIYNNTDKNSDNYNDDIYRKNKSIGNQLLYSYQVNPQTVVFLGYSDYNFSDDIQSKWYKSDKTLFAKFSYAWQM